MSSTFFSQYPKIDYPFDFGDNRMYKQMVDITTNIRMTQQTLSNAFNYNYTVIRDGESPEIVSYNEYGTTGNHHLVIMANALFDWRESYPLTAQEFESYIKEKYANPYGIHHFEDPEGNEIDNLYNDGNSHSDNVSYPKNVIPITNYEYESRINEAKRGLKLVKPEYTAIVNDLIKDEISNNE